MKQLLIVYVVLLSLVSCRDDNGLDINITIKDHRFTPSIITAPAGKKLILIVDNQDNTAEEFESSDLKREKIIPPNSKVRVILAPLKVGEYSFFGEFHEDTCQGKLIIIEAKDDDK